ncbi:MAG TPA: threonine dehydratase [Acidobacteriota bacterium]|nr:threonine dehydratase [Acidobacteriota bacterium]
MRHDIKHYDTTDVNFKAIEAARERIYPHMQPSPLIFSPLLSERLKAQIFLKHENHNPTGSFKVRGGLNLAGQLSRGERKHGIVSATRGNHGQSLAFASRLYRIECTLFVPKGNNPEKNQAMRAFGARLIETGSDFDEARLCAEEMARRDRTRYVHVAEPELLNGVGTYGLEIFHALDADVVIIPVGGGSGVCGTLTVRNKLRPRTRVIAVQSKNAPAVYLSWKEKKIRTTPNCQTIADGLATRVPFELPFEIMQRYLDDFVLVSDQDILRSIAVLLETTHNLVEGAGAAPLAAAESLGGRLRNKKVVLVLSGANIDKSTLLRALKKNTQS